MINWRFWDELLRLVWVTSRSGSDSICIVKAGFGIETEIGSSISIGEVSEVVTVLWEVFWLVSSLTFRDRFCFWIFFTFLRFLCFFLAWWIGLRGITLSQRTWMTPLIFPWIAQILNMLIGIWISWRCSDQSIIKQIWNTHNWNYDRINTVICTELHCSRDKVYSFRVSEAQ